MKRKKIESGEEQPKIKYAKPISLYPLKPEDVLSALMKVDPKKIIKKEKQVKK